MYTIGLNPELADVDADGQHCQVLVVRDLSGPKKWLLLLLSCFSRVRLCATPWTAAYQAPPSMGFSRQEYCSGVPLWGVA